MNTMEPITIDFQELHIQLLLIIENRMPLKQNRCGYMVAMVEIAP